MYRREFLKQVDCVVGGIGLHFPPVLRVVPEVLAPRRPSPSWRGERHDYEALVAKVLEPLGE